MPKNARAEARSAEARAKNRVVVIGTLCLTVRAVFSAALARASLAPRGF